MKRLRFFVMAVLTLLISAAFAQPNLTAPELFAQGNCCDKTEAIKAPANYPVITNFSAKACCCASAEDGHTCGCCVERLPAGVDKDPAKVFPTPLGLPAPELERATAIECEYLAPTISMATRGSPPRIRAPDSPRGPPIDLE